MEINCTTKFSLHLDPNELRIIRKGLRSLASDTATTDEDIRKSAVELNERILSQLESNLKAQLENIQRAKTT